MDKQIQKTGIARSQNVPQVRFPEFNDDWEVKRLGGIGEINPKSDDLPSEFIYIDLESVKKGILLKETKVSKKSAPSRAQRLLLKNDILFQMVRPYQKNNFFFNRENNRYVSSTGYAQIRTNEDSRYLYFYLHTSKFVNDVLTRCTGTSYPAINSNDLSKIPITFPQLPEQKKIAHFFSVVDKKLNQLQEKLNGLELYKKGMMQQIFSQQLRFKDNTSTALSTGNGQDFPNWEVKKLGNYIEVISGFAFKGDDISEDKNGIPLLRGINITEGHIRHSKQIDRFYNGKYETLEKYFLQENDLVIGMDGSKVGKNVSLITKKDVNSLLIQRVARLRSNGKSNINFVFQIIFSIWFIRYVDIVNTSSGIPHISLKQINDFSFNFPSLKEQTEIANFLSKIDEKINAVNTQIETTKTYKKGLLQKMFV